MRHPLRWLAFWAYVGALLLPIYSGSDLRGIHVVLFGVIGLIEQDWGIGLPWLANVGFFLAYILRSGRIRTLIITLALVLASGAWRIQELPQIGGEEMAAVQPGWGFALWYGAIVLLVLDAWLGPKGNWRYRRQRSEEQGHRDPSSGNGTAEPAPKIEVEQVQRQREDNPR